MNSRHIIALSAILFGIASPTWAQEATIEPFVSGGQASRADVQAQALAALRAGELHESRLIDPAPSTGSVLTRAQVREQTLAALRSGEIARLTAEAWSFEDRLPEPVPSWRLAATTR